MTAHRAPGKVFAIWFLTVFMCLAGAFTAWARYEVAGDVVLDTQTGLMWMQNTADTNGDGSISSSDRLTWQDSLAFCENLSLAGHSDWRLPDSNELQSLVRIDAHNPAIDTSAFACETDYYWTGSPVAGYSGYAWVVNFNSGYAGGRRKDDTYYVRCVRSGPYSSFDPFLPTAGAIQGTVTDTSGQGVGGVTVQLSGQTNATATTAADGSYSFSGLSSSGLYVVKPPQDGTFYPYSGESPDYVAQRHIELIDTGSGVADANFIQAATPAPSDLPPFVKLLFPRSGDRLAGDFVVSGTAFRQRTCSDCAEVAQVLLAINGQVKYVADLNGGSSDRLALSQIKWLDAATNLPVGDVTWEQVLPDSGQVTLQLAAVDTQGRRGLSQKIAVSRASTTASVAIQASFGTVDTPVPAKDGQSYTLTHNQSGGEAVWFQFMMDFPHDLMNKEEYDQRSAGNSLEIEFPIEDVYPVCLAYKNASGDTLVDVARFVAYRAARFGDPDRNNSGSMVAALGANVASGNFYYSTEDMYLEGKGLEFSLWRRYNSFGHMEDSLAGYGTSLGHGGWNHSYHHGIFLGEDGNRLYLVMPDGHWERFAWLDGAWRTMVPGAFWVIRENDDGSFDAWDRNNTRHHFQKSAGNWWDIASITDPNGNELAFTYNANRTLARITDTRGRDIIFTYQNFTDDQDIVRPYLTSVSDGTGRSVSYAYTKGGDGKYRLTSFTDRRGNAWTYEYGSFGGKTLLAKIIDPKGNAQITNAYDNSARVTRQTDALGNVWNISYLQNRTDVETPSGEIYKYHLDETTRMVTSVEDPLSQAGQTAFKSDFSRDSVQEASLAVQEQAPRFAGNPALGIAAAYKDNGSGNPVELRQKSEDSGDLVTSLAWIDSRENANRNLLDTAMLPGTSKPFDIDYDEYGNIVGIKTPLEHSSSYTYDATTRLLKTATDPKGNTTTNHYDESGRLVRVVDPDGHDVEYTYDAAGRRETVTDKRGNTTTYVYNEHDQVTSIIDPLGNTITRTYDANGNMLTETDKRGNTTTFTYNALNLQVTRQVDVGGETYVTTYDYDNMQRLNKVTNARGYATTKVFDATGRLQSELDALNQSVEYTYDANGNVTEKQTKDDNGNVLKSVRMVYDDLDRMTWRIVDNGVKSLTTKYTYNAKGLVASVTNPRGKITRFGYDDMGNVTSVTDPEGGVTTAEYDEAGNLVGVIDPEQQKTTYYYDALNRLIRRVDSQGNAWGYAYDANDNVLSEAIPGKGTVAYAYDELNRTSQITYPEGDTVYFSYDANGNVLTLSVNGQAASYEYDELNRLVLRRDVYGKGADYGYDAVGNLTSITYPENHRVYYTYDKVDRVVSVTDWLSKRTSYSYNALGQILSIAHANGVKTYRRYDPAGRLTALSHYKPDGTLLAYYGMTLDRNGNRLSSAVDEPLAPPVPSFLGAYTINTLNQATSGPDSSNIEYDADGNLVSLVRHGKTVTLDFSARGLLASWNDGEDSYEYVYSGADDRIATVKNGVATRYVLDVNRKLPAVIARTNETGSARDFFVYGPAGLLSRITQKGDHYTYHFDPTGNTIALTDDSGNMINSYSYLPYGQTRAVETVDNPFQYVGQYGVMMEDNGLHFMRARFYDSGLRRFLSQDEILGSVQEPQTLNLYAYVQGNPLKRVDPSGKYAYDIRNSGAECSGNASPVLNGEVDYLKGASGQAGITYAMNKSGSLEIGITTELGVNTVLVLDRRENDVLSKNGLGVGVDLSKCLTVEEDHGLYYLYVKSCAGASFGAGKYSYLADIQKGYYGGGYELQVGPFTAGAAIAIKQELVSNVGAFLNKQLYLTTKRFSELDMEFNQEIEMEFEANDGHGHTMFSNDWGKNFVYLMNKYIKNKGVF